MLTTLLFTCYRVLKVVGLTLLGLLLAIWLFSPLFFHWGAQPYLNKHGIEISPESTVRINPFLGKLSVDGLAFDKQQRQVLRLDEFELDIKLSSLFKQQITVERLVINGLEVELDFDQQMQLKQAVGLDLALLNTGTQPTKPDVAAAPKVNPLAVLGDWHFIIEPSVIRNSYIRANQADKALKLGLDMTQIYKVALTKKRANYHIGLDWRLGRSEIGLDAKLQADLVAGQAKINNSLSVYEFNLADFTPWLSPFQAQLPAEQYALITSLQGKLKLALNSQVEVTKLFSTQPEIKLLLKDNSLQLDEFSGQQQAQALGWQKFQFTAKQTELVVKQGKLANAKLAAKLVLNDLQASHPQLRSASFEQLVINDIAAAIQPDGNVTFNANSQLNTVEVQTSNGEQMRLDKLVLHHLGAQRAVAGDIKLDVNADLVGVIASRQLTEQVNIDTLSLQNVQTHLQTDKSLQLGLTPEVSSIVINNPQGELLSIEQLSLQRLNVNVSANQDVLLSAKHFRLDTLQALTPILESISAPQKKLVDADKLQQEASGLSELGTPMLDTPMLDKPMMQVPTITLSAIDVALSQGQIASVDLGELAVNGFQTNLILTPDKQLQHVVRLMPQLQATKSKPAEANPKQPESSSETQADPHTPQANEQDMTLRLAGITLTAPGIIAFQDNSVKPAFQQEYQITQLQVGPINNQQPQTATPLTLMVKNPPFTSVSAKGEFTPFLAKPNVNLTAKVRELELPALSSYIQGALGHEIKTGQFDLDVKLTAKQGKLDGGADVGLRGLALSVANKPNASKSKDVISMPLNLAVGVIKDSDDKIDLSLPISGTTDSPSVDGISSFVKILAKKAIVRAGKKALIETLVPYSNVVTVVMMAGDEVFKLRFNDLIYAAGQTELDQQQKVFADNFVNVLRKKDDAQLKVCAIGTPTDIPAANSKPTEDEIEQIKKVSQQRQQVFKNYVVEQGIASSRLLLCTPELETEKDAKPRLVFKS
ncbi:hypothetical protein C2869_21175 [Saccharobesus litoralis]|uniref:DUF748 domain-containing protein n=1 Tax=Saccharobesus litoralis TaxID=2172099 RepID=A0A2S0VX05_9ALTE|nr:DUF748 domain-containing protein [Saccharobesus litoralis]AWB68754.1 hypothetical protein C2869_21175 [Saccharobesus litoralis]